MARKDTGRRDAGKNTPPEAAGTRPAAPNAAPNEEADLRKRQNQLLDEALKETFPASDPISVFKVD